MSKCIDDSDGEHAADTFSAIETFAPIVYLHTEEVNRPSTVHWVLRESDLVFDLGERAFPIDDLIIVEVPLANPGKFLDNTVVRNSATIWSNFEPTNQFTRFYLARGVSAGLRHISFEPLSACHSNVFLAV